MAIYVKVIEEGVLKKFIPGYRHEELVLPEAENAAEATVTAE